MSMHFQFLDKETGNPVSLNRIDQEMCTFQRIPCRERTYCDLFIVGQSMCIAPSLHTNGNLDREKLLARCKEEKWEENDTLLLLKFFCDDYNFVCWYTR